MEGDEGEAATAPVTVGEATEGEDTEGEAAQRGAAAGLDAAAGEGEVAAKEAPAAAANAAAAALAAETRRAEFERELEAARARFEALVAVAAVAVAPVESETEEASVMTMATLPELNSAMEAFDFDKTEGILRALEAGNLDREHEAFVQEARTLHASRMAAMDSLRAAVASRQTGALVRSLENATSLDFTAANCAAFAAAEKCQAEVEAAASAAAAAEVAVAAAAAMKARLLAPRLLAVAAAMKARLLGPLLLAVGKLPVGHSLTTQALSLVDVLRQEELVFEALKAATAAPSTARLAAALELAAPFLSRVHPGGGARLGDRCGQ